MVLAGKLPGAAAAGKAGLTKAALTYGGLNAASGIAQAAQMDNPTLLDYAKQGGVGFATGAAVPALGAATPKVTKGVGRATVSTAKAAQKVAEGPEVTGLRQTNLQLQQKYDNTSNVAAKQQLSKQIAENNAKIRQIKNTSQTGSALVTDESGSTIPSLRRLSGQPKQPPAPTVSEATSGNVQNKGSLVVPSESSVSPKPSASPEQIGKALGMSEKQVRAAQQPSLDRTDTSSAADLLGADSQPHNAPVSRVSDNALYSGGNRGKSLQKAPELPLRNRSEAENLSKGTKLLQEKGTGKLKPSSSNNATNPTKVNIPEVTPGDYAKARSNAQLASNPIEYAAGQAARLAKGLTTSRLAGLVEGVIKPANSNEEQAMLRYRQLANRTHATSQALGGDTPFRVNYFHHEWDLSNPEDAARFEQFRQRKFGKELNPAEFEGLDTQPRIFSTVAQGEKAGFKLKNPDAQSEILDYGKSSAYALKRQALAKGFMEADANQAVKPHSFDIGQGKTIALSDKGRHEIRAFEKNTQQPNTALKIYRRANRGLKQTLLSASEFHPINITKKVAPALALEGHPVLAAKGAYGAFRAQVGNKYSDTLQQHFQDSGIVDFGARIGSPLKFGSDYATEGKLNVGKAGLGEKTIFEKSMPALHGRALQAVKADLDELGISYDSPEARAAGTRINEMMGFVNTEVRNLDRSHQKFLGDIALAPQFTRAKWATLKSAIFDTRLNGKSLAGSYARSAVIGDTLATGVTMLALGYLAKQKSDNITDMLIRSLVHPSVPTPFKDSKGNTIELGMPSTYASEALGLVANITRNKNGHLGVTFKPSNLGGNLTDYGRARLALVPGAGLKLATNTDFANKPLYDPTAPMGTKAQQAATTLLGGTLPIGAQGILETGAVKNHLPSGVRQVLTANTPGANPVLKSFGSSFGLTPRTDKTVGKGQQTTQYFDSLDSASKGLNRQEKDAFDLYTGGKKNPVTGQYQISPTANDTRVKSVALLQNPKVIDRLISMNQTLKSEGQNTDPLWGASKAQITKYLQYQAMPPAGPDKTDWYNKNQSWYAPLATQRNAFFNTLPAGDPNKPKLDIQYPNPTPGTQSAIDTYNNLMDSAAKGNFLDNHPEIVKQWNSVADYNNKMRTAQGYSPLKNYPEASTQLQSFMNTYSSADKTTRKSIRNSNPQQYQNMIAYFDSIDLYNNNKQGAVSALQGEPDYTSKQAKSIQSLAQDVYQNPDGSYSIVPAGWMQGLSNGSGFGGSSSRPLSATKKILNASAAIKPPKAPTAPHITVKTNNVPSTYKQTTLKQYAVSKPAVSKAKRAQRGII